jgi:hypothetical protein
MPTTEEYNALFQSMVVSKLTNVLDRPEEQVFPLPNPNQRKYETFSWIDDKNKLWGGEIEFKIHNRLPSGQIQVIFSHLDIPHPQIEDMYAKQHTSRGWWLETEGADIRLKMTAEWRGDPPGYRPQWWEQGIKLDFNTAINNPNNIDIHDGNWHKFRWFVGDIGDIGDDAGERFHFGVDDTWAGGHHIKMIPFNGDAVWGVEPSLALAGNYVNFQGEVRNFKLYADVPPTDILLNPPFIRDTPLEIKELDVSQFINLLDQYVSDRDWIQQALIRLRQELQEEIDLNNKLKELQPDETSFLVSKVQDFINQYGTELTDTENELQQILTQLQQLITENELLMNSNKALKEQLTQLNSSGVDIKITNIRNLINKNIKLLQDTNRWGDTTDQFFKFKQQ